MNCPVCHGTKCCRRFAVTRPEPDMYSSFGTQSVGKEAGPAEYAECSECGAMYWIADDRFERIYDGFAYTAETGDAPSFISDRFKEVTSLPPERSDNVQRINRIRQFLSASADTASTKRTVADIGAGMGVFLYGFLDEAWLGTAIEPDPSACLHMRSMLPSLQIMQSYLSDVTFSKCFDLVVMNRTLEHVSNPIEMLRNAAHILKDEGIVYIEVPDVRAYFRNGPHDQDFGYGHYVVFSPLALTLAGSLAGLDLHHLNRVREPSGKFTIYGFFSKKHELLE